MQRRIYILYREIAMSSSYLVKLKNNPPINERVVWAVLYSVLLIIWSMIFFSHYDLSLYLKYFQIPLTMILGSFLGGFTSEGGGAVAFPVFTKLLHISPAISRDFSFAVQSIGMTFASITIIVKRIRIERRVIFSAVIGGILGIIIGTMSIVPVISPVQTKLIFTLVVTSFGVSLIIKNIVLKNRECRQIFIFGKRDVLILVLVGFVGGLFSSMIGTGIHFITFSFVTLFYRLDEKIATPTSIIIMASDSIFGFFFRKVVIGQFSDQALLYFALCVPVVAFFAPLGAIMCSKVNRQFIVRFLLFLIFIEFITTIFILKFDVHTIILSAIVVFSSILLYLTLIKISKSYFQTLKREIKGIRRKVVENIKFNRLPHGDYKGTFMYRKYMYRISLKINEGGIHSIKIFDKSSRYSGHNSHEIIDTIIKKQSLNIWEDIDESLNCRILLLAIENAIKNGVCREVS
jgi:uncharacterized protein